MPFDTTTIVFITSVLLLAGFIKGVIGFGLPSISMGLLGLVMAPSQAAALLLVPNIITNVLQGVRVEETSNLQDWFGGKRKIEISEDVVGLGRYGKTLTVLYDINLPDADEEEDEESLIESWTPRFKR